MGSKHIHTTAYHPESNGMIERLHRSFKAAIMCHPKTPWPELPPIVLLGLKTCIKKDLKSYGFQNIFFEDIDTNGDPAVFVGKF